MTAALIVGAILIAGGVEFFLVRRSTRQHDTDRQAAAHDAAVKVVEKVEGAAQRREDVAVQAHAKETERLVAGPIDEAAARKLTEDAGVLVVIAPKS